MLIRLCETVNKICGLIFKRKIIPLETYDTIITEAGNSLAFFLSEKKQVLPPLLFSFLYYVSDVLIYIFLPGLSLLSQCCFGNLWLHYELDLCLFYLAPAPGFRKPPIHRFCNSGFPAAHRFIWCFAFKIVTSWIWIPFSFVYLLRNKTRTGTGVNPNEKNCT